MGINQVNPMAIQNQVRAGRAGGAGKNNFKASLADVALGVEAMSGAGMTAANMYSPNAGNVISAAFSGMGAVGAVAGNGSYGGGVPSYSSGFDMGGYAGLKYSTLGGAGSGTGSSNPVIPGTEGFTQADMMNTMNQNNLQLLELQATMQSNMQSWNTKSNILSADHRARMAMIEKFTAR